MSKNLGSLRYNKVNLAQTETKIMTITKYSQTCFKRPSIQATWTLLLTGGCLLLNESSAESSCMQ